MKRFVTIVALTCALCVSAYAGDIPMTGPGKYPNDRTRTAHNDHRHNDYSDDSQLSQVGNVSISVGVENCGGGDV